MPAKWHYLNVHVNRSHVVSFTVILTKKLTGYAAIIESIGLLFLHKDPMLRKYITAKYMQTKQERLPSKLHDYFIYKHSFKIRQATWQLARENLEKKEKICRLSMRKSKPFSI